MNICLHDEGIGPDLLGGLGCQAMTLTYNQLINGRDGLRTYQADVVVNAPKMETLFIPVTKPHDLSQGAMLFGEILQGIIVQITSQSGRQLRTRICQ